MKSLFCAALVGLSLSSCMATAPETATNASGDRNVPTEETAAATSDEVTAEAMGVTEVGVSGEGGQYTFAVTIASDETGCDRYANWWEVITEDGTLLYRRILAHSHVDEQPFTRSGGPVTVAAGEVVIVRSHMYPTGYQVQAMQGSVNTGFAPVTLPEEFASDLAEAAPLPTGCAF